MLITDEDLAEYQALRAKNGMPEISNKDALGEANALVSFLHTVLKKDGVDL